MSEQEIPKQYSPFGVEERLYADWQSKGYFHAEASSPKPTYTIVIPPPNATGVLHLGHALNNTLQDIMIRWQRMQGKEVCWLPGTDHAGIATQVVVEKLLVKEHKSRREIGREAFVKRTWEHVTGTKARIIEQLKKMGCACDWSRERFTLDEQLSEAVKEVFIRLYDKGLIYKGKYIVNWCPRCQTSLSDDEVEHAERVSKLYYVRYKLKGQDIYLTAATTRPETMLGDTALAVNPKDERYQQYIGKTAILPILDRELAIVADDYVDMEFGTGVVKITPAHDPNDFEISLRHDLDKINILNPDGTLNENAGKFKGLDVKTARREVLDELEKKGLLAKIDDYSHAVGICSRCATVVEPYLSEQWFVRMKPLTKPAIEALKNGQLRFHPEHWSKTYLYWMENIRDWCISRQLWWGHRIPVYYCRDCNEEMVLKQAPAKCRKCGTTDIYQEEDVLDTWFSSWLWPFSTFGWPQDTEDLRKFYPTNSLFTASEIIFLWVARMVMAGYEFTGKLVFNDVYIHGTVRDAQGRKMSKSLGNGIDPIEVIDQYGADSMRLSLILSTPEGQDPNIAMNTFELGRNFGNKLWNASRFIMMNLGDEIGEGELAERPQAAALPMMDRWILSRLNETIKRTTEQLEEFHFNAAAKLLYDYVWHDYCDWYIELVKPRLYGDTDPEDKLLAKRVTGYCLNNILKLLHPLAPYITEEIWHLLHKLPAGEKSILLESYPVADERLIDEQLEEMMLKLQRVVNAVRNIRATMNIPPSKRAEVHLRISDPELTKILDDNRNYILNLGRIENLIIGADLKKPPLSASAVIPGVEIYVPLAGLIDIETERKRLQKELENVTGLLEKTRLKLANRDFVEQAPKPVVEQQQAKRREYEEIVEKINANLEQLLGW
ncbi:MAG: valine--tRNA ligase [candidate division Zixibacteria bacterium]|nr:valine--tRNA ligase [candidate division Zixibacteria bacterium]